VTGLKSGWVCAAVSGLAGHDLDLDALGLVPCERDGLRGLRQWVFEWARRPDIDPTASRYNNPTAHPRLRRWRMR
jgi:hypothetical protein